jgi:hypothetical protein
MNPPKKCTATSRLLGVLLVLGVAPAFAGVAIGTVTQLSGPLLLKRTDGTLKALAVDAFVEQGDVLVSEKSTYAQLRFADDSEVTLGPDTLLTIEAYTFNVNAGNNMDSIFSLGRGSVQIKTGLGGTARPDLIKLVAPNLLDPAATLTLNRAAGTTFVAQYTAPATTRLALFDSKYLAAQFPGTQLAWGESATRSDGPIFTLPNYRDQSVLLAQATPPGPPKPGSLPPGLYVSVTDGQIVLSNKGGVTNFTAGQFGYTPSPTQPPVMVPKNPAIQFTPPPVFNQSTGPSSSSPSSGNKSNTVDCEVR